MLWYFLVAGRTGNADNAQNILPCGCGGISNVIQPLINGRYKYKVRIGHNLRSHTHRDMDRVVFQDSSLMGTLSWKRSGHKDSSPSCLPPHIFWFRTQASQFCWSPTKSLSDCLDAKTMAINVPPNLSSRVQSFKKWLPNREKQSALVEERALTLICDTMSGLASSQARKRRQSATAFVLQTYGSAG